MQSSVVSGVSDEWLRTFVYEQGKEGTTDGGSESDLLLRLAEARAALRRGSRNVRRLVADSEREAAVLGIGAEEPTDSL